MNSLIFLLYALGHLALFIWALVLLLRNRTPATVPLLIVTFGLVYDNTMLAAGTLVGHGELLERLSVPRYFLHAFSTPLLMLTALALVRRVGRGWTRSSLLAALISALTISMIAAGVDADLVRLELEAQQDGGVISYGNAAAEGAPIAPMVTIAVLIMAGILVWRCGGGFWLLLGAAVQFGAALIADALVAAGNFGELALLAALVVTDSRLSKEATAGYGISKRRSRIP